MHILWSARFEVTCYALNGSDGSRWRQAIEQGIRYAYRMVTVQRVSPAGKVEARQIRVIHSVRDDEGELTYKPIQVIRQSPDEVKYLIAQLQKDADDYAGKMRDVLAEIAEVL